MRKKVVGILVVGLLMITVFPIGSSYIQKTDEKVKTNFESKLFGIGLIQIDSFNYQIKGFVLLGMNDDQVLLLKKIDIKYDGSSIQIGGIPPFVFNINYNPAK